MMTKVVGKLSARLNMSTRIAVLKRYNSWRYGHLEKARRRIYWEWRAKHPKESKCRLRLEDGFAIDESKSLPHLGQVINDANVIIDENRSTTYPNKDFLGNQLRHDDFERFPSFLDFATSADIVAIASEYLDMIPVLSTFELWRSVDAGTRELKSSQLFHLDNADVVQVKVFVHLHDVDLDAGPFGLIPKAASRFVCDKLDYGKVPGVERLRDEDVFALICEDDNHRICTFPEGTVLFVDTIRCLHYGSRSPKEPRHILMLQYLTPCRADLREISLRQHVRADDTHLRKLLLDPSYLPN